MELFNDELFYVILQGWECLHGFRGGYDEYVHTQSFICDNLRSCLDGLQVQTYSFC